MMRAEAVAVVACMNDDRVVPQAASLQTIKDRANALIDQCDQTQIMLFDAAVFVMCNPKKQLSRESLPIQDRFCLLPFTHQTIPQWNLFALRKRSRDIKLHLIEWIDIVKRTVVRRVWFHERDHQNERIALILFDEVARVSLEKLWPRQLNRQIADGHFRKVFVRFVRGDAF